MAHPITPAQAQAMALNKNADKNARKMAKIAAWQTIGVDNQFLWGEFKGSGKTPYQVIIDTHDGFISKCTCSSRQATCKHTLALLYIHADSNATIPKTVRPQWVMDWDNKRQVTQTTPPRRVNPKTLVKRQAEIEAGLDELDIWLNDIIRAGVATLETVQNDFYTIPYKRLRDAKAFALADRVLNLGKIRKQYAEDWSEVMLRELAQIHLIIQSFRRFDKLTPDQQGDLRTVIGWYIVAGELLDHPTIDDTWHTLGYIQYEVDRTRYQRIWLYGETTGRYAVLSDTARGQLSFKHRFITGNVFEGNLTFYPSAVPQRAIVNTHNPLDKPLCTPTDAHIQAVHDRYSQALASNIWLEQIPVALNNVIPFSVNDTWHIIDEHDHMLKLNMTGDAGWRLLALSGGHPVWLFGEWNGEHLTPLTVQQTPDKAPMALI